MVSINESKLLNDWEDVFKQGLLTFWTLTSLKDANLSVAELRNEIDRLTRGSYTPAEQTLYRVLRKYNELNLVEFNEVINSNGPKKKLYSLTEFGNKMLTDFAKRNIELFQIDKIKKIIEDK